MQGIPSKLTHGLSEPIAATHSQHTARGTTAERLPLTPDHARVLPMHAIVANVRCKCIISAHDRIESVQGQPRSGIWIWHSPSSV